MGGLEGLKPGMPSGPLGLDSMAEGDRAGAQHDFHQGLMGFDFEL